MGDSNLTKLTASLEELSLKKQLPLRQTTQKPVLKYNQPLAKPVQLFNHENIVNVSGQDGQNPYRSISQASSNASIVSAPFRVTRNPNPVLSGNRGGGGQTYISPNNVGKPTNQAPKNHTNPYARPLSAKDIVSDLLNQSTQVKRTISSTSTTSPMTGSSGSIGSNNSSGMSFPVNSFMRPQSAVRKEIVKSKKDSPQKDVNAKGPPSKPNGIPENKGSPQKSIQNQENENLKNKTTASHMTQMTVTHQGDQVITTRQGANGVTVIQKVAAPPNFGTQINSIITKVTDPKGSTQASNNTKVSSTKHVSSIPKPGLNSSSPSSSSTSSDSAGKIRNLNYTPTKPYEEVKDPSYKSPDEKVAKSKTEPKGILKPQQTVSTVITNLEEKMKTSPSSVILSQLKETVAQNLNSNGTSYYRKGSKSEIMLHEQRPPVVGAPSKVSKGMEKMTVDEDDGDNDEEEDTSSGPGERLPGDGEASLEGDFGDDDDDGIENLDDDCVDDSEGESDGYSITSSLSRRSSSAKSRVKSASTRRPTTSRSVSTASTEEVRPKTVRPATAIPDKTIKPPLKHSLFPNIPPTVNFAMEGEKVEQLPWEIRKLLKWRMSPITPNIVKHTLARSGFRITKRNHDWLGCWGKHMKSQGFKAIREYQKLNHFPGSFQIGRKDRLWRNLSKMQLHFGKKEFGFFPQTFVLPFDMKLLKRSWEDGGNKQKWIIKPPASARGIGIKVIHKWNQIPRKRPVIVQRYLGRPYLINDSKFDMRIYVYVSNYDPLRVYVFEDGLARFASCKYSSAMKNINNKFMHLTNYSVNKKNSEYQANGDDQVCQGHKWGLKALWNYMKRQGINTAAIWESIKDLVIKTIICAESPINSMIKANCRSRYCVHELFGFDVLLDENLKPWILEVNISPSLHSNSQLDINIKGQMIRDLLNISGFRIPDKADVSHSNSAAPNANEFSSYHPPNDYCLDKRLFTSIISPDERVKHAYYSQRHQDEQVLQTVLDLLTPDDVRVLTESIDEDSRKGGFQRVFPTPSTHKYLRYFEAPRYYNILLDQWIQRYNHMERKGISLLEAYCEDGLHLENPTTNPNHQWSPPNGLLLSHREPRTHSAPNTNKHTENIKSSHSSSQIPKMSKKPPKAPTNHTQHYHAATSNRTISQCSSSSSASVTQSASVSDSPVPQFSKPSGAVNSR